MFEGHNRNNNSNTPKIFERMKNPFEEQQPKTLGTIKRKSSSNLIQDIDYEKLCRTDECLVIDDQSLPRFINSNLTSRPLKLEAPQDIEISTP